MLCLLPQACVPAAQQLLAACRSAHMQVIHTLEAHKADLSDLHRSKLVRGNLPEGLRIGDKGSMGRILVAGEHGNGIIDELAPVQVGAAWLGLRGWQGRFLQRHMDWLVAEAQIIQARCCARPTAMESSMIPACMHVGLVVSVAAL